MMPRGIDHVVWAVADLDTSVKAVQEAGFKTTPRAEHPPHMGTANQLIQFRNQSFIEFLEVDRPHGIAPHDPGILFSFGGYNADYLRTRSGVSMLVFQTDDALADAAEFKQLGLEAFAPFNFGRIATSPEGIEKEVAFRLAFGIQPAVRDLATFTCQNRFPENFWKEPFMQHRLESSGIQRVLISANDPKAVAHFLAKVARSSPERLDDGWVVPCANGQAIEISYSADAQTSVDAVVLKAASAASMSDPSWGSTRIEMRTEN